jgi:ATP adenylyltransferase
MPRPLWAPWRLEYIEHAEESSRCIFCEPEEEFVVYRGEHAFLLLNRFPYTSGHLLVAPYAHAGSLGELDDATALELHHLAVSGTEALSAEYAPQGYNLGWNLGRAAGAGIVDHVHLHVVPRWVGDTNFMPVLADLRVIPEALAETARRLRPRFP